METSLITIPPEGVQLAEIASNFLNRIEAVQILTPEDAQGAVDQTREIKTLNKQIEEYRKGKTKPLDDEKQEWMDFFRPATDALTRAEALLKAAITAFNQEQARKAAEAEKERLRLQDVERQRQEKERLDAEALLEKADQAASDGNYELAETLETQAAAVQQIAAPISVPAVIAPMKARGAATTKKWRCVITDASLIPREWLMPNEKALGVYASSMKDNAKIPGCEFLSEDVLSIR